MRPIARQSSRLATNSRIRRSSIPRSRTPRHQRPFHTTTTQRTSDPRPPNGQADHYTSHNERREEQKREENVSSKPEREEQKQSEDTSSKSEQAVEQENGEAKPTNEVRKPALKRTLRQKRMNDVPKPPPIPEWFLKHNVKLVKDSPGLTVDQDGGKLVHCVDAETGHILFTVPYYDARTDLVEDKNAPEKTRRSSETKAKSSPSSATTKSHLDQTFFNHKFQPSKTQSSVGNGAGPSIFHVPEDWHEKDLTVDPMRPVFLEAELSARAALALSTEDQPSSSFAAERVNLSLQCPDANSHDHLDGLVRDLARVVRADVVRLDANDFAELADEYVGQGRDEPGSYSTLGYDVFDGYEASVTQSNPHMYRPAQEHEENEMDEDDEEDEDEQEGSGRNGLDGLGPIMSIDQLRKALQAGRNQLGKSLQARVVGVGVWPSQNRQAPTSRQPPTSTSSEVGDRNRDDARLGALLDSLLDAPKQKQALIKRDDDDDARGKQGSDWMQEAQAVFSEPDKTWQSAFQMNRSNPYFWLPQTSKLLVSCLGKFMQPTGSAPPVFKLTSEPMHSSDTTDSPKDACQRTIVHVRDLADICQSRIGENIIHRLSKVVQKRRRCGEQIMIVGTTAQDTQGPYRIPGDHSEGLPFRAVTIPPFFEFSDSKYQDFKDHMESYISLMQRNLDKPAYRRILEINLRHLRSTIKRLKPNDEIDMLSQTARSQINMPGMYFLSARVLSLDQVQRLALIAVSLSQSYAKADVVKPIHVALAADVTSRSDDIVMRWRNWSDSAKRKDIRSDFERSRTSEANSAEARVEQLKKTCNSHETRLLSGMVDPKNIKTGFDDVHAPTDTIEALKTLTTLSLLRPDAFKYGVLANDRLPGLLLYGPPGTGKTLLAKAVAKESKATVLEVSGAQIYEKYVGEGEKMVRAVFSLAKKLSPCIVFIDEADAIFGSRSNAGNRNTHREIINQFLREWDGMDDHGVFMMCGTNRPFDLDDAVLRRLPRRLLVDLPVAKDRESILGIHLKNEALDPSVSLTNLAEQTPLYSGSDLKNLSVAAALACVREENDLVASHKDDAEFKLPEKRTLSSAHFDKALAEISASISEDMGSLTAIRKFDEQYGDRKGRRKKSAYGFGATDAATDESAARVRQASTGTSSPP